MRILFVLFVFVLVHSSPVLAAEMADSKFKEWSVFSTTQDGEKICYITSFPKKSKGTYKRRGDPYFLVTYRGKDISEISSFSGYPYKKKSNVELNIDGKHKHSLFTTDETPKMAWAKDSDEDNKIIAEMKKGVNLSSKGYSRIGSYSLDTYSLLGFTKAHNRMKELCKK